MSNIKTPGLQWLYEAWEELSGRKDVIEGAWKAASLHLVLDKQYQQEVTKEAFKRHLKSKGPTKPAKGPASQPAPARPGASGSQAKRRPQRRYVRRRAMGPLQFESDSESERTKVVASQDSEATQGVAPQVDTAVGQMGSSSSSDEDGDDEEWDPEAWRETWGMPQTL